MKIIVKSVVAILGIALLVTIQGCDSIVGKEVVIDSISPVMSEFENSKKFDLVGIWEAALKDEADLKLSFDNVKQVVTVTSKKRGYRNYPINSWSYDGDKFTLLLPHKLYYEVFVIGVEDDTLKGYYLWDENEIKIAFTKISDEAAKSTTLTSDMHRKFEDNLEHLTAISKYSKDNSKYEFTYEVGNKEPYNAIIDEFKLDKITEGKSDISLMKAILDFVCDNFKHSSYGSLGTVNSLKLAMEKRSDNISLNCMELSNLLAELLRVYGVEARIIRCFPKDDIFEDCHVVVDAYSEKEKGWVMLDPTYRLMLKDKSGNYMSVQNYKNWIIKNGSNIEKITLNDKNYLICNDDAGYTGAASTFNLTEYTKYMVKNLVVIQTQELNDIGTIWESGNGNRVYLVSKDFLRTGKYKISSNNNMIVTSDEDKFFEIP